MDSSGPERAARRRSLKLDLWLLYGAVSLVSSGRGGERESSAGIAAASEVLVVGRRSSRLVVVSEVLLEVEKEWLTTGGMCLIC